MTRQPSRRGGRISMAAIAVLCALLILPIWALCRLSLTIDWRLLLAAPIAVSLYTFLAYRTDKRRAEAGEWRIPEANLHIAELLGGWPGAFLAQRKFRHKTAKRSYQATFWSLVIIHQLAALDFLLGWKFATALLHFTSAQYLHPLK